MGRHETSGCRAGRALSRRGRGHAGGNLANWRSQMANCPAICIPTWRARWRASLTFGVQLSG